MNEEMVTYQKKFKENIQYLINQNKLKEAKELLSEYEKIIKDDIEIYSIKSVIAIMEGNLEEAKNILLCGYSINKENFDILYNLGFIYQSYGENELAIKYYKQALQNSKTKNEAEEAYKMLQQLGVKEDKSELKVKEKSYKKILYLGWLGKGNVGDELLYEIFKKMLFDNIKKEKYNIWIDSFCPTVGYEIDLSQYDLIVLGGGSLFLLSGYEDLCLKAIENNIPVVTWGTGIDLRDAEIIHNVIDAFEKNKPVRFQISRTFNIINNAKYVSVRGNLDKFLLNNNKIQVIGDPGIIFGKLNKKYNEITEVKGYKDSQNDLVLINWGTSFNNIAGKNEKKVEEELKQAVDYLLAEGYKVIVYPIWVEDISICKEFVSYFNSPNIKLIEKVYDVYGLAYLINKCRFTINFKLHANVLSMAMQKPFIALAYGLKCYDFAESINSVNLILHTDEVSAEKIIEKVKFIEQNYANIRERFSKYIDFYQEKQLNFMDKLIKLIVDDLSNQQKEPEPSEKPNEIRNERKLIFKSIGKNVQIERDNRFIDPHMMEIGNNVYIGFGGFFVASGGIKIGDGSILAHNVEIMTRNHNYDSDDLQSIPYDSRFV